MRIDKFIITETDYKNMVRLYGERATDNIIYDLIAKGSHKSRRKKQLQEFRRLKESCRRRKYEKNRL